MKKWFFLLLAVIAIGTIWYYLRTYVRYRPEWDKAKFGEVTRGDIHVPITASGLIEANERINIKSEASGQVLEIKVVEGDSVKKGDVLAVLKKDDEERRLVQAQANLTRAKAALAKANVAVEQAQQNILSAEARIDEIKGNGEIIAIRLATETHSLEQGFGSNDAVKTLEAQVTVNAAQLTSARANLQIAKNNLTDAGQNVIIQEAAVEEAQKQVEDAEERLSETTIVAPQDGIVTEVMVAEGDLVQSATQSFVGGTQIMMLADVSKLKVVTRVDEADIGRVRQISPIDALPEMPGLRQAARESEQSLEGRTGVVRLTVDAFPEKSFEGQIERVEPQGKLNPGSAIIQYDVHVAVTDKQANSLPLGTQAQVEFTVESVSDALLVPAEAVMTFQDKRGVWIKTPPDPGSLDPFGKKFVPCRLGITDGARTQLVATVTGEELKPGQKVFTKLPRERKQED
jgi:HlyD family secretion protein